MIVFSDIDNTLLFSHHHTCENEKVWVEELNGKPQSFVTKRTFDFFVRKNTFRFVPLTTRTKAQYERVASFFETIGCEDALICNGALLFCKGQEDKAWTEESKHLFLPEMDSFNDLLEFALKRYGENKTIVESSFLFYVKTENPQFVYTELLNRSNNQLSLYFDSRKVYCLPARNNKGEALCRYINRAGEQLTIAIGDSDFDISMLNMATYSMCPSMLCKKINKNCVDLGISEIISDMACTYLEKIEREGIKDERIKGKV